VLAVVVLLVVAVVVGIVPWVFLPYGPVTIVSNNTRSVTIGRDVYTLVSIVSSDRYDGELLDGTIVLDSDSDIRVVVVVVVGRGIVVVFRCPILTPSGPYRYDYDIPNTIVLIIHDVVVVMMMMMMIDCSWWSRDWY
jgi:hypothetical protein